MRAPDVIIGSPERPYMLRWWLLPKNRFFNVYLHHFMRSDDDRALHDHPWWNISVLLWGSYIEHMPSGSYLRKTGAIIGRRATAQHRIELIDGPVWTLFITGPKVREWGFWCPQGFRHWKLFTAEKPGVSDIGRGCE